MRKATLLIKNMQKPPRFGEKITRFDEEREKKALDLYKEFISRPYNRKSGSLCLDLSNFSVFNVVQDSQGLHNKFGLKSSTFHYISAEEAFFLSTRKQLNLNPTELLKNTHIFIQKILLYSFFKRKGGHIKAKDTSLPEALSSHLALSSPKLEKSIPPTIKSPEDRLDLTPGDFFITCETSFEKLQIKKWDFK
jgi:hypothetical protein